MNILTKLISIMYEIYKNYISKNIERKIWRNEIKKFGDFNHSLTKSQKKEAREYWKKYTNHFSLRWHKLLTAKTGIFNVEYIPEDFQFVELEPVLNNRKSDYGIDDKNNYKMYFPEVLHPKSCFRLMNGIFHDDDYSIISYEKAVNNCIECGDVIFKIPKLYGIGHGIRFWKISDGEEELKRIIDEMGENINAEEYIHQHKDLALMNPNSCNTIRVVTYMNSNCVRTVCSYFQVAMEKEARMGQVSVGGVCVSIKKNGTLEKYGYDINYNKYDRHSSGTLFEGYVIPSFKEVCKVAETLHQKLGDFKIVSWDFTVDKKGKPIFIEMNLHEGGIMYHQLSGGPFYKEMTKEILNDYLKYKK